MSKAQRAREALAAASEREELASDAQALRERVAKVCRDAVTEAHAMSVWIPVDAGDRERDTLLRAVNAEAQRDALIACFNAEISALLAREQHHAARAERRAREATATTTEKNAAKMAERQAVADLIFGAVAACTGDVPAHYGAILVRWWPLRPVPNPKQCTALRAGYREPEALPAPLLAALERLHEPFAHVWPPEAALLHEAGAADLMRAALQDHFRP